VNEALFVGGSVICWGVWLLGSLAYLVFGIWTLIDCAQNESSEGNEKLIWILVILFAFGLGPLIYFFVRRPQRMSEVGH
jgi:hypothetical protein